MSQKTGQSIARSFFVKMMSKNSVSGFLLEKISEAKDGKQKVTYIQVFVKMMSQNSVSGFLLEKIPEAKDGKQKVTYIQVFVKMMSQNSVSGFLLEKISEAKDGKQKVTYIQVFVKMMSQNSVSGFLLEKVPEAKDGKQKVTCSGIQFSRSPFLKTRDGIFGHQFNKRLEYYLIHTIGSPFYWRILKNTILCSGF
jgi:hypothetical protein